MSTPALVFPAAVENSRIGSTPRWTTSLGNTFILNPTTVVNVIVGAGKFTEFVYPLAYPTDITTLGFPASFDSQIDVPQTPGFGLSGYYVPGSANYSRATRASLSWGVHASKQFNSHSLKFGIYEEKFLPRTHRNNFRELQLRPLLHCGT